jgi:hypothetical protein
MEYTILKNKKARDHTENMLLKISSIKIKKRKKIIKILVKNI